MKKEDVIIITKNKKINYFLLNDDKLIIDEIENDIEKEFKNLKDNNSIKFIIFRYRDNDNNLIYSKDIINNKDIKNYNEIISILENKKATIKKTKYGFYVER